MGKSGQICLNSYFDLLTFSSPFDDELGGERIKVSIFSTFQIRTFSTPPLLPYQARIFSATFSESVLSGGYQGTRHVRMRNKKPHYLICSRYYPIYTCMFALRVAFSFSFEVVASFGRSGPDLYFTCSVRSHM